MCLKERHFLLGCFGQAQLVRDLLLTPALHYHITSLEMVCEVLHDFQDTFLSALVR